MKIALLKEKLKEGVKSAERICSRSSSLPMLNNILLKGEKNFFSISATDLEIGLKWWILAKTDKEGEIAVPSRLFSDFISLLPAEKLELEISDLNLKIKHEDKITKIKGFSTEDFPLIPVSEIEKENFVSLSGDSLGLALQQILPFTATSTSRPEICGVLFQIEKNQLILAATDSFRLAEKKIPLKEGKDETFSFILPQKAAREVVNIFGDREEIKLYFSPNQVMFEALMEEVSHPQVQLVSKLIEGEYPNYQEIIPKEFITKLILDKKELIDQIKLASLFTKKSNEIKLKIDSKKQRMEIFCENPETGEYKACLPAKVEGSSLEIAFNYKFLLDGLIKMKEDEIFFGFQGEERAVLIKPNNVTDYIYIVMPMKAS